MVKSSAKQNHTSNSGSSYDRLKRKILKYGSLVILFVLIFDKLTLLNVILQSLKNTFQPLTLLIIICRITHYIQTYLKMQI